MSTDVHWITQKNITFFKSGRASLCHPLTLNGKLKSLSVYKIFKIIKKTFHIYTDASDNQLGAVIMQKKKTFSILHSKAQRSPTMI